MKKLFFAICLLASFSANAQVTIGNITQISGDTISEIVEVVYSVPNINQYTEYKGNIYTGKVFMCDGVFYRVTKPVIVEGYFLRPGSHIEKRVEEFVIVKGQTLYPPVENYPDLMGHYIEILNQ